MRQTVTTMVDDLDGTTGEVTTVPFALDGKAFEIDLSGANHDALHEALAPFIEHARPVKGHKASTTARPASNGTDAAGRAQTAAMRAWLKGQGYQLADRGRIPGKLKAIYRARA